jgi:nitrite reductase/ring-hydroxylating ferredoxin subunit
VLEWLTSTPYADWVRESWGWPLALTVHAFGTATVVGFIFIIGLRLLGLFRTIPMLNGSSDTIANLVEPGRVHRRVYADPDVFELEMERIFGRAWLFVGHTSQVPQPGDYFTTELGRQPVVMTRHRDGTVHVLFNRCTHRGAKVANERCGHAARLTCLYHGWSFDTDGTLAAVPMPEGCAEDFRKRGVRARPGAARRRIPRLRVREPRRQRGELRGPYRPDQIQHRRSRRSRARRRARLRPRRASLRLMTAIGSCRSRTCSIPITCRSATPRRSTRRACSSPAARATRPAPSHSQVEVVDKVAEADKTAPPNRGKAAGATSSATATAGPATPRSTTASVRARPSTNTSGADR